MKIRILETIRQTTLFGIRFWDPVLSVPVTSGLVVRARREAGGGPWLSAQSTPGGVFAFHHLPEFTALETTAEEFDPKAPFPGVADYIIRVSDRSNAFVDTAFRAEVPFAGIFPTANTDISLPETPGIDLFSHPLRKIPSGFAAVYAHLKDAERQKDAPYALVKIQSGGVTLGSGISDRDGKVVVVVPYPPVQVASFSPPLSAAPPLGDQRWPVELRVFYNFSLQHYFPAVPEPDLRSVIEQPEGLVFPAGPDNPPGATLDVNFGFNLPAVAHSQGFSELYIGAA